MEGLYREHRIAEKGHLYHFPPLSLSLAYKSNKAQIFQQDLFKTEKKLKIHLEAQ